MTDAVKSFIWQYWEVGNLSFVTDSLGKLSNDASSSHEKKGKAQRLLRSTTVFASLQSGNVLIVYPNLCLWLGQFLLKKRFQFLSQFDQRFLLALIGYVFGVLRLYDYDHLKIFIFLYYYYYWGPTRLITSYF